ncbi:MAG: hypothetical protein MI867_09740 [Pseudomonadales bacterium]|nr:hypothetical protein [Pseudomonadales bacterium]
MDIIKGLTRLQFNLESLIASSEANGCEHIGLIKRCYCEVSAFIENPTTLDPEVLEQLAIELVLRPRNQDQLPEQDYDKIAIGLKLLARMRKEEIEKAVGPESFDSTTMPSAQPKIPANQQVLELEPA